MRRGWQVELKDGTIINENQMPWNKVPKKDIICLSLLHDGRRWDLRDKQAYFTSHTASVVPGINNSFQIEKRVIGFYEGAVKVYYIVDEFTGRLDMRVKDNGRPK